MHQIRAVSADIMSSLRPLRLHPSPHKRTDLLQRLPSFPSFAFHIGQAWIMCGHT